MGDSYDDRIRLFAEQVPPSNPTSYQLSVEALVDTIVAFQRDIQEIGANQNVTSFVQRCKKTTPRLFSLRPLNLGCNLSSFPVNRSHPPGGCRQAPQGEGERL